MLMSKTEYEKNYECHDFDDKYYDKSFLEISDYLATCNVNNYQFPLYIFDPKVKELDPYDPELSDHAKESIKTECKRNLMYFLRRVVRIPVPGEKPRRFKLNKQNCAQIFCYLSGRDTWSSSPRQMHRTVSTLCIMIWESIFYGNFVSLYGRPTNNIHPDLFRAIVEELPSYLYPDDYIIKKSTIKMDDMFGNNRKNASREEQLNRSIGLLNGSSHFQDAEFLYGVDLMYNEIKRKNINGVVLLESTYNPDYHLTGARNLLLDSVPWEEGFYNTIGDIDPSKLIHIEYRYKELFSTEKEAEVYYDTMRKALCNINKIICNEILLERPYTEEQYEKMYLEDTHKINELKPIATRYDIKMNL